MRKLIKATALILGMLMLAGCFTGCAEKEDNGPFTYAYITATSPATLDPGVPQYDSDLVKYIGLLYEGLFRINDSGKLEKALCDDYYTKEVDGEKRLYLELKDTCWSDGVSVTASNIVYAWKRLLESDYEAPGASMLMCLKNAVAAKEGVQKMMTIDDVGLVELNEKLIEVRFEDPDYDVDLFIQSLASPYLVPVREELVAANPTGWATVEVADPTTIATNGPYCIAAWTAGGMTLKRNGYYYLKGISTENKQKYVNPEKITIKFTDADNAAEIFEATKTGNAEDDFIFYLGEFSDGSSYKTKKQDMLSTTVIYLNTSVGLLNKKATRQALSAALDRNEISSLTGGKPATGIVPYGVFETAKTTKQFRKVGGNLLSAYTDTSALGSKGTLTLTVLKDKAEHEKIAEYVQEAWKKYGITVKIRQLDYNKYSQVVSTGSYEALLLDLHAYTTDAFSVLGQFSLNYNGRALSQNENYEYGFIPHSTGYNSENYNELINSAFAETKLKPRAKLLHDAEYALVDAMVAIPLLFNQDEYVTTQMSGIGSNWYAYRIFNEVKVKNYTKYIEIETAKAEEEAAKSQKK